MENAGTERIPEHWKSTVCRILHENRKGTVIVRKRAREDWESTFPDASFEFQRNAAICAALKNPDLFGRRIEKMKEPGEVWEFFLTHEQRTVYVKLNLCPGGKVVILYSAHRPLKGDQL